jgi:molybdate transport system substrate-binding protein
VQSVARWARATTGNGGSPNAIAKSLRRLARCFRKGNRMLTRLALIAGLVLLAPARLAAQETIVVFAAASLKKAIDDVNAAFSRQAGLKVATSYAASPALARQIEQGAPADIFISADRDWMDYAEQKQLIRPDTRADLLGNRLVLIAPKNAKISEIAIGENFDIAALAADGRIAIADTRAVPAGKYAKQALEKLGAWAKAAPKLAMSENVRAALAFVARGEAPLGIVYETDARIEPQVKIVGRFPESSHAPIVYPVAMTMRATLSALSYLDFLRTNDARSIFENYGFSVLTKP